LQTHRLLRAITNVKYTAHTSRAEFLHVKCRRRCSFSERRRREAAVVTLRALGRHAAGRTTSAMPRGQEATCRTPNSTVDQPATAQHMN